MFTSYTQLSPQQITDLKALHLRCQKELGSAPNIYAHILSQLRMLPACTLYYNKHQLLGFISVFFFYDDAVEISLLVDASMRRQGLATELLRSILPLIKGYHYKKLFFSSPHQINDSWLKSMGFTYMHCEYYMVRDALNPILESQKVLTYKTAALEDLPILAQLDEQCFHKNPSNSQERYYNLIGNNQYKIFLALKDNKPIGKAHIRWEGHGASLSDIAVTPQLQGQGYGTALIAYCVNFVLGEGKKSLNLDVETHNEKALKLYTQLGFVINNACDYWSIGLDELDAAINEITRKF